MDKTIEDSTKQTYTATRKQKIQYFSVSVTPQNQIDVLQ